MTAKELAEMIEYLALAGYPAEKTLTVIDELNKLPRSEGMEIVNGAVAKHDFVQACEKLFSPSSD